MPLPMFQRFNNLGFLQGIDKPKYLRRLLAPFSAYFARQKLKVANLDNSPASDRALLAVFTRTGWRHSRVTLSPTNRQFQPIVVGPEDAEHFLIVAEFVAVLRPSV